MLEQFLVHIKKHNLISPTDQVLLAISGGVDSMVMLHLFQQAGYSIGVAHCNFQLRGEAADGDELFVIQTCKALRIPVFTKRFNTAEYAEQKGVSIQMAARELRYNWFNTVLQMHDYTLLATAHHLDDTVETILLNWTKGAGLEGLMGIPVKNQAIIRPLLFASRKEIETYAQNHNITWREDESNASDDYQRNFIRHQIIPKLKEINPSLEKTVQSGLEKLYNDLDLISHDIESWRRQYLSVDGATVQLSKRGFVQHKNKPHLLWRIINKYGFNREQAEDIVRSMNSQPGKLFLTDTHKLVIDRENLVLTKIEEDLPEIHISPWQEYVVRGPLKMTIEQQTAVTITDSPWEAYLDADKISFPLTWRNWQVGDAFYPLGMADRKKVSDFLIDSKVSRAEKDFVTVLESKGEIVWVVGHRIDNRFKLEDNSQLVLRLSVEPHFPE